MFNKSEITRYTSNKYVANWSWVKIDINYRKTDRWNIFTCLKYAYIS